MLTAADTTNYRCTLVEPIIRGFVLVKFNDEPEVHKLPLKAYEQCLNEATKTTIDGGVTRHRCAKHPVSGGRVPV